MYSLIGFSNAVVVEAVVLKTGKTRLRVAVAGLDDTLELQRVGPEWFSETGERVTFEFLAAEAPERTTAAHLMTSRAAS